MKIKEGFLLRNVADMNIVVPVAQNALRFKSMLSLNETGAFLWKALEKEATKEELVQQLMDSYEVEEETAKQDVAAFLEEVEKIGALA